MTGKFISYGKDYIADYDGTTQYVSLTKDKERGYGLYVYEAEGTVSTIISLDRELKQCNYIINMVAFDKGVTKSELNNWKKDNVDFINTTNYSRNLVDVILRDGSEIVMYIPSFCVKDFVDIVNNNKNELQEIGVDSGDVLQ